jgi:hypothetical protein
MTETTLMYLLGLLTIPVGALLTLAAIVIWNLLFAQKTNKEDSDESSKSENGYYD